MAKRDFVDYLYSVQETVLAAREDLKDFEKGLKEGYITEDRLEEIKEELAKMELNYQRLLYCEYLLDLPVRKQKKKKYTEATTKVQQYFDKVNASAEAVEDENKSALSLIQSEIKLLETEIGDK